MGQCWRGRQTSWSCMKCEYCAMNERPSKETKKKGRQGREEKRKKAHKQTPQREDNYDEIMIWTGQILRWRKACACVWLCSFLIFWSSGVPYWRYEWYGGQDDLYGSFVPRMALRYILLIKCGETSKYYIKLSFFSFRFVSFHSLFHPQCWVFPRNIVGVILLLRMYLFQIGGTMRVHKEPIGQLPTMVKKKTWSWDGIKHDSPPAFTHRRGTTSSGWLAHWGHRPWTTGSRGCRATCR